MNRRLRAFACVVTLAAGGGACGAEPPRTQDPAPVGAPSQDDPPPRSQPGTTPAADPAPSGSSPVAKVDLTDLLTKAVAKNAGRGGGILRAATASGVVFEGAAGNTELTGGKPMTPDTFFEIASISKTFTAAVVLLLAEEGKLSLDAPLSTVLPASVTNGLLRINGVELAGTATIRQLLSHTSGLPDYWLDGPLDKDELNPFTRAFNADVNRFWDPLDVLTLSRQLTPIHAPGGAFHYCDTGYVLLGVAIEKLEGKSLQDVYRSRIYAPLGMTSTYLSYREQPPANAVISHRYEGKLDLHARTNQTADWAGGGLVSTAPDLERFIRGLAEGKLFASDETLAAMTTLVPTDQAEVEYGLGVFHFEIGNGGSVIGHDGWGNAFMYYWREKKVVFTGTLNQNDGNDFFPMVDAAARRIAAQ